MTPLGWARANLIYDSLERPPKPGSILEAVCLMVQMRREVTQFYSVFAMVQAIISASDEGSGDVVNKAFSSYRDSLMPFLKNQMKDEQKRIKDFLSQEVLRGPLKVQPMASTVDMRNKLKKVMVEEIGAPPKVQWRKSRKF
jgi:hypothetical protein